MNGERAVVCAHDEHLLLNRLVLRFWKRVFLWGGYLRDGCLRFCFFSRSNCFVFLRARSRGDLPGSRSIGSIDLFTGVESVANRR